MKQVHSPSEFKALPGRVGFVPTMGALHEGHLSLVRQSKLECDSTVVSIFVNPTQFNNPKDLENYPNRLQEDLQKLEAAGVDVVFTPTKDMMYPGGYDVRVTEDTDAKVLCGAHRPGHFTGVLTVVLKLLNIVKADRCYMGEKDFQQLHLIRKMARELFIPTKIIDCPTVREADGLAMSSRNLLLSPAAREKAPLICKLLNSEKSTSEIQTELSKAGFQVDYVEEHWGRRFAAATIEGVRLIDNVEV